MQLYIWASRGILPTGCRVNALAFWRAPFYTLKKEANPLPNEGGFYKT